MRARQVSKRRLLVRTTNARTSSAPAPARRRQEKREDSRRWHGEASAPSRPPTSSGFSLTPKVRSPTSGVAQLLVQSVRSEHRRCGQPVGSPRLELHPSPHVGDAAGGVAPKEVLTRALMATGSRTGKVFAGRAARVRGRRAGPRCGVATIAALAKVRLLVMLARRTYSRWRTAQLEK